MPRHPHPRKHHRAFPSQDARPPAPPALGSGVHATEPSEAGPLTARECLLGRFVAFSGIGLCTAQNTRRRQKVSLGRCPGIHAGVLRKDGLVRPGRFGASVLPSTPASQPVTALAKVGRIRRPLHGFCTRRARHCMSSVALVCVTSRRARSLRRSTGPTHTPNSSHGPRRMMQYGEQSGAQMRMPQWQLRGVCRACGSARRRATCTALARVCHRRSGSCRNSLGEPSVCESAGLARRARFCAGSRWRLDSNNSQHVPQ